MGEGEWMRMWPFLLWDDGDTQREATKLSLSPPRRTQCRFHMESTSHYWPVVRILFLSLMIIYVRVVAAYLTYT